MTTFIAWGAHAIFLGRFAGEFVLTDGHLRPLKRQQGATAGVSTIRSPSPIA